MAEAASIRPLEAGDLSAYKQLRDAMLEAHPESFTSDAEAERGKRPEAYLPRLGLDRAEGGHFTLGAWAEGGRLVGTISCERDLRRKVRHTGHVVGMMVRAEARCSGVGTALLDVCIGAARRAGLELLTLSVTAGNDRAVRLYEARGFVTYGHLPRAIRVGSVYHDKLLMTLAL